MSKELALTAVLSAGLFACGSPPTSVELDSDHEPLVEGFAWAKRRALSYARSGDPVGPWYEAALPGREAFCMRDVSHQSLGAEVLGLSAHNKNMFHKFADAIAESRDWCSYWEINRYDEPAPVDYRSDDDFWYNLPANFDVVQAMFQVYEWTGDEDYLNLEAFENFSRRTLTDYIAAWDADGDGIMESPASNGSRGLATYWEGEGTRIETGGDLIAAQYAANVAFARVLELRGNRAESEQYATRGRSACAVLYNNTWWDPEGDRFHPSRVAGGSFGTADVAGDADLLALFRDRRRRQSGSSTRRARSRHERRRELVLGRGVLPPWTRRGRLSSR